MLRKAVVIFLVGILLLQTAGFIPIHNASAQERYTYLKYSGRISYKVERELLGVYRPVDARIIVTSDLIFDVTLSDPDRIGYLLGRATAKGTFSGTIIDYGYGCPSGGTGTVAGTYDTTITASTEVGSNKVSLFVGDIVNYIETKEEIPRGCWNGKTGSGASNIRGYMNSFLTDCFNSGRAYTHKECGEFPVLGDTRPINIRPNDYFKSVFGTAQLTLVDSKKEDPFDFSMSVTPPEIKVYKGGTTTYAVSVSTLKGKAAQVTLSAPNVEGLGLLAFDRTSGTPPFNAKLTVPAGQANPGRYALQVVGTAGDLRKTTTVTLVVEDCPKFTITPTMPAANDPREFTTPNGKASFRFDIVWEGKIPVSVALNTAGGVGTIQPSFAFNPVRMLNNKANIIMDVTTANAGLGNYPIAVTATINDPELPADCSRANTNVVLVVGESRAQDLPLQPRPNPQPRPVQIAPIKVADQQGNVTIKGNLIQAGNDGKAKLSSGNTTLDVNRDTKVWRINWDNLLEDIDDDLIAEELSRRPPDLLDIVNKKLKSVWDEIKIEVKSKWSDYRELETQVFTCLFPITPEVAEICSERDSWFLEKGEVHYFGSKSMRKAEVIHSTITGDGIFLPSGTEFILSLDDNGNTKLTVLEGQVLFIQFSTKQVMLLNATQQLAVQVQQAGGNSMVSNRVTTIDSKSLDQWWLQSGATTLKSLTARIQFGDHVDPKLGVGAKTIPITLRANVSGGKPPYAYLWDMGDGIVKEGESVYYEYAKAGLYTVTLRVRDVVGQVFTIQQSVKAEVLEASNKFEQPAIATPSGIGDDVTGAILGTLLVFMVITGAFLRPFRRKNLQPPSIETRISKSKFRPRNMVLLGAFLIIVPFSILLSLNNVVSIPEGLAIGTIVITWIPGFLLLLAAPVRLIIDKARKKKSL